MPGFLREGTPTTLIGPDPGRTIRVWVALLLRLGIGLSLLGTGLSSYRGLPTGGGMGAFSGPGGNLSMLDPFVSGLPYLAIGLGLALILGFLTTASAIAAGFFNLIIPVFGIIQMAFIGMSAGFGMRGLWANNDFLNMIMAMTLPNLLTNAAMIWLSPLENNPFSVDALIFGRNDMEPIEPRSEAIPTAQPIAEEEPPIQIGE